MRRCLFLISVWVALIVGGSHPLMANEMVPVTEFHLPNGMTWLLVNRDGAPVFSSVVMVKVGGVEERIDQAGIAHMFEHMAFKGSPQMGTRNYYAEKQILAEMERVIQKIHTSDDRNRVVWQKQLETLRQKAQTYVINNEVWETLTKSGAHELNAMTSKDSTAYYMSAPSTAIELWLKVNSQMVGNPVMREFYKERDVVQEERRASVDTNPSGLVRDALLKIAFDQSPYRFSVIGSQETIGRLTATDAMAFHGRFYTPDRMVGVIVGSFDVEKVKRWISAYYGSLRGTSPDTLTWQEPPQTEARHAYVTYDAEPQMWFGYRKPPPPEKDDYVFDLIQYVECEGENARLKRLLVDDGKLAAQVKCGGSFPGSRYENLFVIVVSPVSEKAMPRIEKVIDQEMKRLMRDGVSSDEMTRALNNLNVSFYESMVRNDGLASSLATFQTVVGDWRYILTHSEKMATITSQDVMSAAKRYLQSNKRNVGIVSRKGGK